NYSPSNLHLRGSAFSSGSVLSGTQSLPSTVQTGTAGLTALITPGTSNELRANYSNHKVATKYALDNFGGAVPLSDSLLFPPGYSSANGLLQMVIVGVGEFSQGALGTNEQRQINLVDNLSVIRSSHQMKFGVDYRGLAPFSDPSPYHQFAQF